MSENQVAQLTFYHPDGRVGTIATNGDRHVVQVGESILEELPSLFKAIAFLEVRGFKINNENFKIF